MISWIAIGGLLAVSVYRLWAAFAADPSVPVVPIILATLLFAFVILAVLSTQNEGRLRYMRREFPDAYAVMVEIYPDSIAQICRVVADLGGTRRYLRPQMLAMLSVTGADVEILGGWLFGFGGRPKILASFAWHENATVAAKKSPQGLYNLKTIEISFDYDGQHYSLNLLPFRTVAGLIPWMLSSDRINAERDAVASVMDRARGYS